MGHAVAGPQHTPTQRYGRTTHSISSIALLAGAGCIARDLEILAIGLPGWVDGIPLLAVRNGMPDAVRTKSRCTNQREMRREVWSRIEMLCGCAD